MGMIVVQVYMCSLCRKVFEVQEYGVFFPPCPFCGNVGVIHRGKREIETQ